MKSYTLKELNQIYNWKYELTLDRFIHYFTLKHGFSIENAKTAYKVFVDFPNNIINNGTQQEFEKILPLVVDIITEMEHCRELSSEYVYNYGENKDFKKLIYKEDDTLKHFVYDSLNPKDVLLFSDIFRKKNVKIIKILNRSCRIEKAKNSVDIFVGDIYSSMDRFWGEKSNLYIAKENGNFNRLLYIKGKGYIQNGKPNIDTTSYNSYALSLNDFHYIGNITTDIVKLTDNGDMLN